MPHSRSPQNNEGTFNSAWDRIQRRKGRKRHNSIDSTAQPRDRPGQNDPPHPSPFSPFSPLPNINRPLPGVPPSRHSTRDTLPDISTFQPAETNDTQQHDAEAPRHPDPQSLGQPESSSQTESSSQPVPGSQAEPPGQNEPPSPTQSPQEPSPHRQPESKTSNMQKAVTSLSALVEGLLDCLQTARDIFVLLFKTIYLFLPIFLIRLLLKTIIVILIILQTLMFASESIHRGFCHMAPQLSPPLLATALVDMAKCAALTQDVPVMDSGDTLDGLVAMVPPVWRFLAKNGDMIVREFPEEWEMGTYIKRDFESFSAKFKDAAGDIQALEDDFTENQKHQWSAVDDFISKFNNIPPNAVWYRFLDLKVYDVKAHNSQLISILKDAQNNTRQVLANIPTDKATGIYGKLFNLEALAFYEDIREAFMQSSGVSGLSVVVDNVMDSWTVGIKTSDFLAGQLAKRRGMLEKDDVWLSGRIEYVRRRGEELALGRGKQTKAAWNAQVDWIDESHDSVAKDWKRKLRRYFVEEVVDMD